MCIVRTLYHLKTSGEAFRAFLAETLHDLGFTPSQAEDPDEWMRPAVAVKEDCFRYWELLLCYVDDVLSISHKPENALKGIQMQFKL